MTTRQHILDILDGQGRATIEQIADALRQRSGKAVSSVTIRYHLNVLLAEGMIAEPQTVPRASRGRPQHVFEAIQIDDPNKGNTAEVLTHVLAALHAQPGLAELILERAALTMAEAAAIPAALPLKDRMAAASMFLNARGYDASVEQVSGGFILYTRQCPYHDLPERQSMCNLDMRLIETMAGQSVKRLMRLAEGDDTCAYFIPNIEEIY